MLSDHPCISEQFYSYQINGGKPKSERDFSACFHSVRYFIAPQFLIYLLRFTYASTSSAIIDLRRAKEVSLEAVLIGYHRRKKILGYKIVYNSEWKMRQKTSF